MKDYDLVFDKDEMNKALINYKKKYGIPFIIEVSGTPNSGKTPAIKVVEKFIRRNKVKYKYIREAAIDCKINNKLSEYYNLWTLTRSLELLIDVFNNDYYLVICERGIFDALCWMEFHKKYHNISEEEYKKISDLLLLKKFTDKIAHIAVFKCDVKTSIIRECPHGIKIPHGTIVNNRVLPLINESIESIINRHKEEFKNIAIIETSDLCQDKINCEFAQTIKNCLQKYL